MSDLDDRERELEEARRTIAPLLSGHVDEAGERAAVVGDAAAALRRSERLLRAVYDNALDSMLITTADGTIVEANPAAFELFGRGRDDLVGRRLVDLCDPEGLAMRQQLVERGSLRGTIGVLRPSGERRMMEFTARARILDSYNLAICRDVTEQVEAAEARARAEAQLLQAQKMEAIGRLAGGVAHDFNNMLAAIQGFASVIESELREGDPLRDDVGEILRAAERAADLTRQLLAMSRKQPARLGNVDARATVGEVERMLRRVIGEDVVLVNRLPEDLGWIHADRTQLEQVLLNLAVNARDAMPEGGRLVISGGNVVAGEAHGVVPGEYVELCVSDTGCGMDEATRQRAFEPFFTTKARGQGTGLGLSTVYSIVRQCGGQIALESAPGEGTAVRLLLPRVLVTEEAAASPARPRELLAGTERVLIVEDEPLVRRMIVQVLSRHGYDVYEAANGGEALLLCEQLGSSLQALVSDVIMPRMSGFDLVQRLRERQPELRVVYATGYSDVPYPAMDTRATLIGKPFAPDALLRALRRVLDAPDRPAGT